MQDERPFQESMEVCTSVTSFTRFVLQLADIAASAICDRIDRLSQVPSSHNFFFLPKRMCKEKMYLGEDRSTATPHLDRLYRSLVEP